MDESRRSVLKKLGVATAAAGLGFGVPLLRTVASPGGGAAAAEPGQKQYGMVLDIEKCLNKGVAEACIEACRAAHNWADFPKHDRPARWIWTETFEHAFHGQSHGRIAPELRDKPVLLLCNHCSKPACVKVCPTKATWKRKSDGIVMMDMHRCIGCRFCVVACPYRARSFNWSRPRDHIHRELNPDYPNRAKGLPEKCTFCAERLRENGRPACVEAAEDVWRGKGALNFGDLNDPDSKVAWLLRKKHTICRLYGLGTNPNIYYIV